MSKYYFLLVCLNLANDKFSITTLKVIKFLEKLKYYILMQMKVLGVQSCPTPYNPMDCSLPDSSIHGILQARILEQVVIPFSRESSLTQGLNQHLLHWQVDSLSLSYQEIPAFY